MPVVAPVDRGKEKSDDRISKVLEERRERGRERESIKNTVNRVVTQSHWQS